MVLGLGALLAPSAAGAAETDLGAQREAFLAAEAALGAGDLVRFRTLADALRDYPLHPYLVFQALDRRIAHAAQPEIRAFLEAYPDTLLAERLRDRWLSMLGARERWLEFLEIWQPAETPELRCLHARALIESGRESEGFAVGTALWLFGQSRPQECDPVFASLQRAGRIDADLLWRRIELAMSEGETGLAAYLGRSLPPTEQAWVDRWRRIHARPASEIAVLADSMARDAHPYLEAMVVHGMERLARTVPEEAGALWPRVSAAGLASEAGAARIVRQIGLTFAYRRDPRALEWLEQVPAEGADEATREWAALTALYAQQWQRALAHMDRMDPELRDGERWTYWRARALGASGSDADARALLAPLAGERSFHGFLAADRLGLAYSFGHRAAPVTERDVERIAAEPGFRRARELLAFGRVFDARREWMHAIRSAAQPELLSAARLAHEWAWHGQAIITLGRSGFLDDLDIRFPLPYRDQIDAQARAAGIDAGWMFAVVRQESAFLPDARSPKGALGLMQILPATGRSIARRLAIPFSGSRALFEPELNLRLGAAYLRTLLDRLGHQALATAAYNASPGRVEQWRPRAGSVPADIWIETVPFGETQSYLRRVFTYGAIYEQRLGLPVTRLTERLPVVPPGP